MLSSGLQSVINMADNKLKEPVKKVEPVQPVRRKSPSEISRRITRFMNTYGIFNRNQIVRSMPFILFLTLLIIGYIGNSYYAERIIREIDKTKSDLKEKRAEYISTMSRLMYQSNQSQVAKALEQYQVKETTESPSKIFVETKPAK